MIVVIMLFEEERERKRAYLCFVSVRRIIMIFNGAKFYGSHCKGNYCNTIFLGVHKLHILLWCSLLCSVY